MNPHALMAASLSYSNFGQPYYAPPPPDSSLFWRSRGDATPTRDGTRAQTTTSRPPAQRTPVQRRSLPRGETPGVDEVSVTANLAWADVSDFSESSTGHTGYTGLSTSVRHGKKRKGNRYELADVYSFDISIPPQMPQGKMFDFAAIEFGKRYECVIDPGNEIRKFKTGTNNQFRHAFYCTCFPPGGMSQQRPGARPASTLFLRIETRTSRDGFDVYLPRDEFNEASRHFRNKASRTVTMVPSFVTKVIASLLTSQPTSSDGEVLMQLASSSTTEVRDWVGKAITHQQDNRNELFAIIKSMCEEASSNHAKALLDLIAVPNPGQHSNFTNTVQQVQRYIHVHSINKHQVDSNLAFNFPTVESFCERYGFESPSQILTLPVSPIAADDVPNADPRIHSMIAVTTPSAIFSMYVSHMDRRNSYEGITEDTLVLDGKFKLCKSKLPVMITMGRQHPRLATDGNFVRSFFPLFHILCESEYAGCVETGMKAFGNAVTKFAGVPFHVSYSVSDMGKGLVKGVRDAFRDSDRTIDREHLRAAPEKLWRGRFTSQRNRLRAVKDMHDITFALNSNHQRNIIRVADTHWRRIGAIEFANFFQESVANTFKLQCNAHSIPLFGMVPDTSGLEKYFALLMGCFKTNTKGIVDLVVLIQSFLVNGLPKITAMDHRIHQKLNYGRRERPSDFPVSDEMLACALLYDCSDRKEITPTRGRSPGLCGYLYNSPPTLGTTMTDDDVAFYFRVIAGDLDDLYITTNGLTLSTLDKRMNKCHVMTVNQYRNMCKTPGLETLYRSVSAEKNFPANIVDPAEAFSLSRCNNRWKRSWAERGI